MNIKINDINRKLLMDRSSPGRVGATLPPSDVPKQKLPPDKYLRENINLPELLSLIHI